MTAAHLDLDTRVRVKAFEFLREQTASYQKDGKGDAATLALADFCQALLGSNEFVYVD